MQIRSRDNLILLVSLLVSILMHLVLLAPILTAALRDDVSARALDASFDPTTFEELRAREIELGIDADTSSTLTWIGYEEYEKHLAQLAEQDQAAFVTEPVGAAPLELAPPSMTSAAVEPMPTQQPMQPTVTPSMEIATPTPEFAQQSPPSPRSEEPESATDRTSEQAPPSDFLQTLFPEIFAMRATSEQANVVVPTNEQPQLGPEQLIAKHSATDEAVELPPGSDASPTRRTPSKDRKEGELPTQQPQQSKPDTQSPQPATPTPPTSADQTQPQPQPPSPAGQPEPGEVSDQESMAFSMTVSLEQIKLGKPIARPGLEVKPRRPEFTILQRLTRSPNNPVCEIHFGRDGRPTLAGFVRSPRGELLSTGAPDIDAAVRASLYRWRASGERLESLGKDETLNIRIHIIFHTVRR